MSKETLLRTKLFIPVQRRNQVVRPRLQKKLAYALHPETRLTLVCAPAGFGKTTIIREWLLTLEQNPKENHPAMIQTYAWINLEKTDNDPLTFWRYFCAAMENINPALVKNMRPALFTPQPQPVRVLLNELVNDLINQSAEFILVLDDYHLIENEKIHKNLDYLLETPAPFCASGDQHPLRPAPAACPPPGTG